MIVYNTISNVWMYNVRFIIKNRKALGWEKDTVRRRLCQAQMHVLYNEVKHHMALHSDWAHFVDPI